MNERNTKALPTIRSLGNRLVAIDIKEQDFTTMRCEVHLTAPAAGEPGHDELMRLAWSLAPDADRCVRMTQGPYTEVLRVLCRSTVTRRRAHTYSRRLALARVLLPVLGPAVHEAVRAECRALLADRKRSSGG